MNNDYLELLRGFSTAEARYLIVGAYAVAVHGRPRSTGDLDIWVEPTPENAIRVLRALVAFGTPASDLTVAELSLPGLVYQIGVAPRRIDILTSLTGLDFPRAWESRVRHTFADVECPVLGREDLKTNKRAVGRPRDLADIADLEAGGVS